MNRGKKETYLLGLRLGRVELVLLVVIGSLELGDGSKLLGPGVELREVVEEIGGSDGSEDSVHVPEDLHVSKGEGVTL